MSTLRRWTIACAAGVSLAAGAAFAQQKELKIGYQPNPIQDASIAMMEKWGAKNNVRIVKVPNSYGVYVEKMTASLTSGSDQYDVIWHNDDWGQLWAHLLEPTDDVAGLKYADPWGMDRIIFDNAQGKTTTVPMGHTFGVFFYRTDLLKESELPRTWSEMVNVSKKLQAEGKVKWGYVGAMSMNNSWFSWFWTMWTGRPDRAVEKDRRPAAQHGAVGQDRQGRPLHAATEEGEPGHSRQGARRLLLREMAGGA